MSHTLLSSKWFRVDIHVLSTCYCGFTGAQCATKSTPRFSLYNNVARFKICVGFLSYKPSINQGKPGSFLPEKEGVWCTSLWGAGADRHSPLQLSGTLLQPVYLPFVCLSSCLAFPRVPAVTMTAAALIGDQLILEEDYDDTYIPSEQGTQGWGVWLGFGSRQEYGWLCVGYWTKKMNKPSSLQ